MRVWITGASSGIGEEFAYLYAKRGDSVVVTSNEKEKLETVASKCLELGAGGAVALPFDLLDSEGIAGLVRQAWDAFGGLDLMYCNAGISQRTTVEDTSMEMIRRIMEVNYFAPVAMAKAILPLMLEAGGGHIAAGADLPGVGVGLPGVNRHIYSSPKWI